jgi:EmrB/QacA subfamily drug resistance transporter
VRSNANPRWTLAATILGSLMAFIDGTVVNVALPVLQSDLHATITDAQWIVNAYLLVLSALILTGGSLGDRLGLIRVFAAGVLVFTAASICCGLAPSASLLILARGVQGLGAALLVPGSLAIIAAVFPRSERGWAIGIWSAFSAIAAIAGPLLGGVLVQMISWRAVFFINVPIAAVVLWILMRHMPAIPGSAGGPIDWPGAMCVALSLGAITWTLIEAPSRRGPPLIAAAIAGAAFAVAFVFIESRAAQPLVPLQLFRSRAFSAANALTLLLYAALGGAMFLLPFEWIQIRHYTAAQAGAAFLPVVCTMSVLSPLSGKLADRIGSRPLLMAGPVIAGIAFAMLAFLADAHSYWKAFAPALFVLGVGMGFTVAPLTTTVMTSIDDDRHAGAASGVNNAVARVAGLLATAIFGAIAVTMFSPELDRQLAARGADPSLRQAMASQRLLLANAAPPRGSDPQARAAVEASIRAAFHKAFRFDMFIAAGLALASAAAVGLWADIHGRPRGL